MMRKRLPTLPTILTTTGILATFVGIALGLLDLDSRNIQGSLPQLLGGLKTAFFASVAGVAGALTIKLRHYFIGVRQAATGSGVDGEVTAADLASLLKGIQQALVGNDEATLVSQLKLLRLDTNERLEALRKAQTEALQKLSEMGSASLVEALRDVIKDFNEKLSEQFGENFKQLNDAVGKLLVWQEQYKDHISAFAERQTEIAGSMRQSTSDYNELVTKSGVFTTTAQDLSGLLTALETQKHQLVSVLTELAKLLQAASGSLPQIETKLTTLTNQLAEAVTTNQKQLSQSLLESSSDGIDGPAGRQGFEHSGDGAAEGGQQGACRQRSSHPQLDTVCEPGFYKNKSDIQSAIVGPCDENEGPGIGSRQGPFRGTTKVARKPGAAASRPVGAVCQ